MFSDGHAYPGRWQGERWDSIVELSERILRTRSATSELERWCSEKQIGNGHIVALQDDDAPPQSLDDTSLEALNYPAARERARFPPRAVGDRWDRYR
jgi:hypothetical protein